MTITKTLRSILTAAARTLRGWFKRVISPGSGPFFAGG